MTIIVKKIEIEPIEFSYFRYHSSRFLKILVYLHFRIESQLHKLLRYVKTYFISEYSARLGSVDEKSNGGPGWRCEKD